MFAPVQVLLCPEINLFGGLNRETREKLELEILKNRTWVWLGAWAKMKFKLGESYLVSHAQNLELELGSNMMTA